MRRIIRHSCAWLALMTIALAAGCKRAPRVDPGTSTSSDSPILDALGPLPADLEAAPLDGYRELALTTSGGCAIHETGRVACWGERIHGKGTDWRSTQRPAWVSGLSSIARLATGASAVCASAQNGQAWCWGLGPWGTSLAGNYAFTPTRAPHLDGLKLALSPGLGTGHGCGVNGAGDVLCWGEGRTGATGIGQAPGFTPAGVIMRGTLGAAAEVACAARHACARLAGDKLVCWGHGEGGELGDGDAHERDCVFESAPSAPGVLPGPQIRKCADPEPIFLPQAAAAIGPTKLLAPNGRCALTDAGVKCWGKGWGAKPVTVLGSTEIAELAGADEVVCARSRANEVTCFGDAVSGHLRFTPPRRVRELDGATRLAARDVRICAIVAQGRVRCIGKNASGLELVDWTTR